MFLLDCLLLLSPALSHPSISYSRQLFSVFDSVSAFSISLPCFQFITLASIILRSRFRYPVVFISSPSYTTSLFHLVLLTRHLYNMSPIVTFLVSGLLFFIRRYVAFYPGVSSHVPRTIHGLLFFRWLASPWVRRSPQNFSTFYPGVQVGCCPSLV